MSESASSRTVSVWRNGPFVEYWSARTISMIGTGITMVVLPMLVYEATRSPFLTSMLTAFQVLPYLVLGLIAGAVADRVDRLRLMIGCDLASAVLVCTVPVAAALGFRNGAHLLVTGLALATAFVWFDAANFGAVPQIVGLNRVVPAMSAVWVSEDLSEVGGPLVAGGLIVLVGAAQSLSVDAASYLVSAFLLLLVRRSAAVPARSERPERTGLRKDIAEGLRFIWDNRLIRAITLSSLGVSIAGGAMIGLLVVFADQALGLDPTAGRVAFLFMAVAVGGALASVTLPYLSRRVRAGRLTLGAMACNFAALIAVGLCRSFGQVLLPLIVYQLCYALVTQNGIVLRQVCTPERLVGRVSTTARIIGWGGRPLGATIGGLLATVLPVRWVLVAVSALILTGLLWGLSTRLATSEVVTGRDETLDAALDHL